MVAGLLPFTDQVEDPVTAQGVGVVPDPYHSRVEDAMDGKTAAAHQLWPFATLLSALASTVHSMWCPFGR